MTCDHPACTGIHKHRPGRSSLLCPAVLQRERELRKIRKERKLQDPAFFTNEVRLTPGRCIAWTMRGGHCRNAADGKVCADHEQDFADDPAVSTSTSRKTRLTDEDVAYLDTVPACDRTRERKRLTSMRARQDPEYRERHLARKREMRAAGKWSRT